MKKTILIIDDDAIIQRTTSVKLKEAGYEVVSAADTSAALRAINTCKPDIILLDVVFPPDVSHGGMPSWDGLALMNWVRSLKTAEQARVIIITGQDPETVKSNKFADPSVPVFQKPINHEALLATIASELSAASH